MTKIRITREFRFEMAHALWNYDGKCKNIHGHSYVLRVTVTGEPPDNPSHPKNGMVLDFSDLKDIVNSAIVNEMDHSVVLNKKAPSEMLLKIPEMFGRLHLTDYQPTCENLVIDFAGRIMKLLPRGVFLFSVRLYETDSTFAEWLADDNNQ